MVSARNVEVPADGVAIKRDENDIPKGSWHELQLGIAFGAGDRLAVHEHAVFQSYLRLTQHLAVIGVNLSFSRFRCEMVPGLVTKRMTADNSGSS